MRRAQTVLGPLGLGGAWIGAEHVILGKGWPPLWLMRFPFRLESGQPLRDEPVG